MKKISYSKSFQRCKDTRLFWEKQTNSSTLYQMMGLLYEMTEMKLLARAETHLLQEKLQKKNNGVLIHGMIPLYNRESIIQNSIIIINN